MTLGLIVGNRGFFPDHLAASGRREMLAILEKAGVHVVAPSPEETKFGAVETREESHKCADLFRKHRDAIDGVIVSLPNFGEERAIADTLRQAGLNVPVLIQATPDTPSKMAITRPPRLLSAARCRPATISPNTASRIRSRRSTPRLPIPTFSPAISIGLLAVCRVVRGLRNLRIGAIGARPAAFNTVRYSEKLLEANGISVEPIDLSEILGRIARMKDDDPAAQAKLAAIRSYVATGDTPASALMKMAKLGAVIDDWMEQTEVAISAIQCWTSLEEFFGVVPCTVMSMMSDNLLSSACEVDICGVVGMHALRLASDTPSALLDWNNNYGDDPDKAVCFHCSNLPKHFFEEMRMDFQQIIAGTVGKENTYGTYSGRVKAGPDELTPASPPTTAQGTIDGYVGDGEFTDDPLDTFGGAGVVHIPRMQDLLRYICERGFEHHVAANCPGPAVRSRRVPGWSVRHVSASGARCYLRLERTVLALTPSAGASMASLPASISAR